MNIPKGKKLAKINISNHFIGWNISNEYFNTPIVSSIFKVKMIANPTNTKN
jgi:hypothetical protein